MTPAKVLVTIIAVTVLEFPSGVIGASQNDSNEKARGTSCSTERLYFNQTGKCYTEGSRGPCAESMTIQPISKDSRLAKCDCEIYDVCYPHPNLFLKEHKRCFYLFDQGPCPNGQWLILNSNRDPVCEAIPCLKQYEAHPRSFEEPKTPYFIFSYKNACYVDGKPADFCKEYQVVTFDRESLKPSCSGGLVCPESLAEIDDDHDCGEGLTEDSTGGCEPNVEI